MTIIIPFNPGCKKNNCVYNCSIFDDVVLPAIKSANGLGTNFDAYHDELNGVYRCIIFKYGKPIGRYEIVPNSENLNCNHVIINDLFEEQIEKNVKEKFEKEYCRGFPMNGCGIKKDKEICKNTNKAACEKSHFWTKVPVKRT